MTNKRLGRATCDLDIKVDHTEADWSCVLQPHEQNKVADCCEQGDATFSLRQEYSSEISRKSVIVGICFVTFALIWLFGVCNCRNDKL
jgi:hypothetical protein